MTTGHKNIVVFHDVDPMPPKVLATLWSAGDLIDQTPYSYGIRSWDDLIDKLIQLRNAGIIVHEIHVWCHGYRQGPVLGCVDLGGGRFDHRHDLTDEHLRKISGVASALRLVWWRCCDTGSSYVFPLRVQRCMPWVTTVHHAAVISGKKTYRVFGVPVTLPSPWWQDNGCALKPNEEPWWKTDGSDLKGCLVTTMSVPDKFYRLGHP